MPVFQGIPKFYRNQSSPIVQDSAFPPFNIEHRYKGVYERAGFDIYKNDKLDRSIKSRQTHSNSNHANASNGSISYTGQEYTKPSSKLRSNPSVNEYSRSNPSLNQGYNYSNTSLNTSTTSFNTANVSLKNPSPYGSNIRSVSNPSFAQTGTNPGNGSPYYKSSNVDVKNNLFSSVLVNQNTQLSQNNQMNQSSHLVNQSIHSQTQANTAWNSSSYAPSNTSPTHSSFHNSSNNSLNSHAHSTFSASERNVQETQLLDSRILELEATTPVSLTHDYALADKSAPSHSVPQEPSHQHTNSKFLFYTDYSNDQYGHRQNGDSENDSQSYSSRQYDSSISQHGYQSSKDFNFQANSINSTYSSKSEHQSQTPLETRNKSISSQTQFDPRKKSRSSNQNKGSNDQLASALEGLSQDVHDHIQHKPTNHQFEQPSGVPYPTKERFSFGHKTSSKPEQLFQQFQSSQVQQNESLNTDYENFLSLKGQNEDYKPRNSALTMVSSIISKDSHYSNEDDEIERELENQLASLKINGGAQLAINSPSVPPNPSVPSVAKDQVERTSIPFDSIPESPEAEQDNDHYVTNHHNIPSINIIPDIPTTAPSSPTKLSNNGSLDSPYATEQLKSLPYPNSDFEDGSYRSGTGSDSVGSEDFTELSSSASYNTVEPLFVRHSHVGNNENNNNEIHPEDDSRSVKTVKFNEPFTQESSTPRIHFDNKVYDTPESAHSFNDSVKPLSPKNHEIEAELEGMNFRIRKAEGSPSQFMNQDFQTQESFDNEELSSIKENDVFPPGEGPCRTCNYSIIPGSKGSQKAIYSKTGELSGQWHRSCFRCSYEECGIQFDKHVQCYAFQDLPYCKHHYHLLNKTICAYCSNGIEGECIENELEQKWHLNCLKCQKCHNNIKDDYYLINNNIFCEHDAFAIINGGEGYTDSQGNVKSGLSKQDRIEKRRTRLLFVD